MYINMLTNYRRRQLQLQQHRPQCSPPFHRSQQPRYLLSSCCHAVVQILLVLAATIICTHIQLQIQLPLQLLHAVESSASSSSLLSTSKLLHRNIPLIVTASGIFGRSPSPLPQQQQQSHHENINHHLTTKFDPNTTIQPQQQPPPPPPLQLPTGSLPSQKHSQPIATQEHPSINQTSNDESHRWNTSTAVQPIQHRNTVISSNEQQQQQPPPTQSLIHSVVPSQPPSYDTPAVKHTLPLLPPPPPSLIQQNPPIVDVHQQQRHPQQISNEIQSYQEQLYYLHQDLELAYQREQQLLSDLHNLTSLTQEAKQRESLHMHQLDVLTERIIQIETNAAQDQNQLLEYQNNCTNLLSEMEQQKGYVQEWQEKCQALLENHKIDEATIQELKKKVKDATREVEALATMIEEHRLNEEGTTFRKQRKEKKKKSLNFFAWLFGWNTDDGDINDDTYEIDHQDIYDTARSTLLTALQNERNNVNELESAIVTLQQNLSAIENEVQSRDATITDLTNRMTSYEEEKQVLKAALRQLQMERNEEAPKQQALTNALEQAQNEISRLTKEMDTMMERHNITVATIHSQLDDKVEELKAVQYNLTVMGTYVNKLEERLTDFTVARRDIEERELFCKDIETKSEKMKAERDQLQTQVNALEQEHDDLKALLSELVQERSKLLENLNASTTKTTLLEQNVQLLRQSYAKVDNEVRDVRSMYNELQTRKNDIEMRLNETISQKIRLEEQCEKLSQDKKRLQLALDNASTITDQTEQQQKGFLDEAMQIQTTLERRVADLEKELVLSRLEHNIYKDETQALLLTKEREIDQAKTEEQQRKVQERIDADEAHVIRIMKGSESELTQVEGQQWNVSMTEPIKERTGEIRNQQHETKVYAIEEIGSTAPPNKPEGLPQIHPSIQKRRQFGEVAVHRNKSLTPTIVKPIVELQKQHQQQALVSVTNTNSAPSGDKRKVPFRQLRKLFAKATGVHGLITKSTRQQKT